MGQWNRILVGVDGSPHSRRALGWAADEAARHRSELALLTAYLAPPPPPSATASGTPAVHGAADLGEAAGEAARELMMDSVRDVIGEDPPFPVQPHVRQGNAAKLLIDLSEEADVLVVGTRGHGGFAGMLLGSVSQNVAAHARCTVVVVR